ncbi:MAG TPA: transposase [Streptosporangiaceae bacterium]|jgi:putative transposase
MSRFRLDPTPAQAAPLATYCAHARFVARREFAWLRAGSQTVQRIVAVTPAWTRRLSRRIGHLWVPKIGWVRLPVRNGSGGTVVGIDRGVAVAAALSTSELLTIPAISPKRQERLLRLRRRFARSRRGSNRRARTRLLIARLLARGTDARNDWLEKLTTDLARRFSLIRVEDLNVRGLTRSARGTKAPGRVEKVNPAFTSQRCSVCGHVAADNRKSQAMFACVACHFTCNADVNAAVNIAAGRAVTARRALQVPAGAANREPQFASFGGGLESPASRRGRQRAST